MRVTQIFTKNDENQSILHSLVHVIFYESWIVRSSFADSKNFSFITRISLINCKFVRWFNEVRSLIITRSLKVKVNFGGFRRPYLYLYCYLDVVNDIKIGINSYINFNIDVYIDINIDIDVVNFDTDFEFDI